MKHFAWLLIFLLSGCVAPLNLTPTATTSAPLILSAEQNSFAPQPNDETLNREAVVLTSVNLIERVDLNPTRVVVDFYGSMPSVCNSLRVKVNPPDANYRIAIEAYSVRDPKTKCNNVFQQFETSILLGTYSPGKYSVIVNDEYIGDFVVY